MAMQSAAFLFSLFISRLADQMLLFLVPLAAFQVTQDVAWSGYAFAAETFPRFLSLPVCGALCDRVSPLNLLRGSQFLRAAVRLAGELTTQGVMARGVMRPRMAHGHRFDKVLAHAQTAEQAGMVLGPLVAAALFALR